MPVKNDPLEAFKARRAAERLAAQVIPAHAESMKTERKQTATPPPPVRGEETKREEPTEMHYRPTGMQPGPSMNTPGTQVPRVVPFRPAQPAQAVGPVPERSNETKSTPKVDPLEAFKALRIPRQIQEPRPIEKMGQKIKLGRSM